MQYLLYPIAIYLIIIGIRYLVTFLHFRKVTLQYAKFKLQPKNTVPAYIQKLFQAPIAELSQFGFKPCAFMQTQTVIKLEPPVAWELLLYHPELKTYAQVSVRLLAESADLFDFDFYTFFKDRTLLITTNGRAYGILGEIPQATVQDPCTADLATHWQTHQNKLSQSTDNPACALPPDLFVKALQAHLKTYNDRLVEQGILLRTQPAEFKIHWQTALRQTPKTIKGSNNAAKLTQQRRKQAKSTTPIEIPVELEVQSYQRLEYLRRDLVGRKFRTWLLFGSLAIFLATYTQFLNAGSVGIFMAALLFHEAGHLLAMKLFGYRNTALLFLPFLGALATAHKDDATLSQKFWISLAGPLPGLVLGIGLALLTQTGTYPEWVTEATWILIGLNLFNLLPIYPLDGGQIADLLIFSRHPYVGVVFKAIGVVLLALLGLGQPMLLVFAGLIALSIPNSFRVAKVSSKLRKELRQTPATDQITTLHTIFQQLKQLGHGNLPFNQRYGLAKTLLLSRHELQAKRTTRTALGLLYSLSLIGGIAGTLQALLPNWGMMLAYSVQGREKVLEQLETDRRQQIEQATLAIQTNPDDIAAYQKRVEARMWLQDYQGMLADYDQLVRLKPNDVETLLSRATYRSLAGNPRGAVQDYDAVLRLDPQHLEAYQSRARLRMNLKDYKGAVADYNTLVKLSPNDFWTYLDRGYARRELKDYKGAIADANSVLQLEPDQPDAYALRSEVRRLLGDQKGAIADQQKADLLYQTWDEEGEI